jgi:hypothetical protein
LRVFGRIFYDIEGSVFNGFDSRGKVKFSRCVIRVGPRSTPESQLRRSGTMFAK